LVLGAGVTGLTLLSTFATSLLLRRFILASVTRGVQGRDRTLEGIRKSLARVEDRLAGVEAGGATGAGGSGGGGGGGGEASVVLELSELRNEIEEMREDLVSRLEEMEDALWESAQAGMRQEDGVVAAG
jgi:hypothetical protein